MRNLNNNVAPKTVKKFSDVVQIERKVLREFIKPHLTNQTNSESSSIWGTIFNTANFLANPFGPQSSSVEEPMIDSSEAFLKHWAYSDITNQLNKLDKGLSRSTSEMLDDQELCSVMPIILSITSTTLDFLPILEYPAISALQFFVRKFGSMVIYKELADFLTEKFSVETINAWHILMKNEIHSRERFKVLTLYKESTSDLMSFYLLSKKRDCNFEILDDFSEAQMFLSQMTPADIKIIANCIKEISEQTELESSIYRELFYKGKTQDKELGNITRTVISLENFLQSFPKVNTLARFQRIADIEEACKYVIKKSKHITKLNVAFDWLYKEKTLKNNWDQMWDVCRLFLRHAKFADQIPKMLIALHSDSITYNSRVEILKIIFDQLKKLSIRELIIALNGDDSLIGKKNERYFAQPFCLKKLLQLFLEFCKDGRFNQTSLKFLAIALMPTLEMQLAQLKALFTKGLNEEQLELFINCLEKINASWAHLTLGFIYSGDLLVHQSVCLYANDASKEKKQCLQLARYHLELLLEDENYKVEAARVLVNLYHPYGEFPAYWRMHCIIYSAAQEERKRDSNAEIVLWVDGHSIVGKVKLDYKMPCSFFKAMHSEAERSLLKWVNPEQNKDEQAIVLYKSPLLTGL